jgi:exodeoxyribonuclease V beta subunit
MTALPRYPKPGVLAEVPPSGHAVIEASAGTGKTFTLQHLVIELLLTRDIRLDQILVVTFTEKATGELKVRLREMLERLLGFADGPGAPAPADPAAVWTLDASARAKLTRALRGFDGATIATIHAFCQRVLVENAFASGRLFGETQIDAREAFSSAFRDALRGSLARDEETRPYLERALRAGMRLDAVERLLFDCNRERGELRPMFEPDASRAAILACPLGRDVRHILAKLASIKGLNANTRRAIADRVTRLDEAIGRFRVDGDLLAFLEDADALRREYRGERSIFVYLREQLARLGADDLAASVEELDRRCVPFKAAIVQRLLPPVEQRLAERKREAGLFDFDDMLLLVRSALEGPRGESLARALRARYRAALIDEFQDTDDVQWSIFRRLFVEGDTGHALYVIGDPKQAIYAFRGADVHTYLRAKSDLRASAPLLVLDTNFRSTARLVAAHNRILDQSAARPLFSGDIRYDVPVRCGDETLSAVDERGRPAVPVKLFHFPATVPLRRRQVMELLGGRIAAEIRALLSESPPLRFGPRGAERPLRASDIYVLTRTIDEGLEIGEALRGLSVPYAFFKQDGLFQTDEARHIRDLLAALAEPHDRSRRLKAFLTPFFEVPLDELARCHQLPATHPLLARLADWRRLAEGERYEQLFTRIVEESGIARRLIALREDGRELTNILHIFELLLERAHETRATLPELVAELDAFMQGRRLPQGENGNVQRLESDRHAVQIMTMHKAKGLEAAVVFLAGGFTRPPPRDLAVMHEHGRRIAWVGTLTGEMEALAAREAEEEDQRLLYVALTRAKARVYLPLFGGTFDVRDPPPSTRGGRRAFEPEGTYEQLNRRLIDTVANAELVDPLFEREELVRPGGEAPAMRPRTNRAASLASWRLPDERARSSQDTEFRAERDARLGPFVTSYTQLRGAFSRIAEEELVEAPDDLPGGAATGSLLHEALERVDLPSARDAKSLADWTELPAVRDLFDALARHHDLDRAHLACAKRVVHTALTTQVRLGDAWLRSGVASSARTLRELEFVYPVAQMRGFVRGYIDVLLEHEGRAYVVDWKSDRLPSYDGATMRRHVEQHYLAQLHLYCLAAVRIVGVKSEPDYDRAIGGFAYLFVRGMRADDATVGTDFRRPTWSELVSWEAAVVRAEGRGRP